MRGALQDLAGKGLVYGIGASFNGLVTLILIPYFIRRLTATEYGRYALAEMVLSLILVPLSLGLNVAILARFPSVPEGERNKFIGSTLTFVLLSTAALEFVFLAGAQLLRPLVLPVLDTTRFLLVGGISALETVWLLFATLYRARGQAWRYIAATALQATVGLVATVYLIDRLGYRDDGILLGRLVGDLTLICALLPELKTYRPRLALAPARDLLRIGLPLIPATFSSMWVLNCPRYFIQWYGTVADVGAFAMSSRIAGLIQLLFIQPFAMSWMVSLFVIFRQQSAERIFGRIVTYYLLFGVTLALALGLLAQVFLPVVSHDRFPLSAAMVLLVGLAHIASGLMYPLNIGPYVQEQTFKVTPIFLLSGISVTALGLVMTRIWGAPGAGVALLCTYLIQAGLLAWLSQRMYPIAFEVSRIVKVLLSMGVAFVAVRLVVSAMPHSLSGWLVGPLFLGTLTATLLVLRFPEPAEISQIRGAARWIVRVGREDLG